MPSTPNHLIRASAEVLTATALLAGAQAVEATAIAPDVQPVQTANHPEASSLPESLTPPAQQQTDKPDAPHITPTHIPRTIGTTPDHGHTSVRLAPGRRPAPHSEHWTQKVPDMPRLVQPTKTQSSGESTTPTPPPSELLSFPADRLQVPTEISSIMHSESVYLPALMCSGFLVRNQEGAAVGVETAQHCSLRYADGHWTKGDGTAAIDLGEPITVQTGDSLDALTDVGNVSQVILNGPDDTKHDQALLVLDGHDPEEVLNSYNQFHLSPEEITALPKGSVIYDSGWPVDQLKNPGTLKRQEFAMTVLGTATWNISNGDTLKLLLAAVPESSDGAECSWGNSGSEAFVLKTIAQPDGTTRQVPYSIGTASAFNDFGELYNAKNPAAAATEKSDIEATFGVSMDGYAAVCGFAYETPSAENGMVVASVVEPKPPLTPEQLATLEEQFQKNILDPSSASDTLDGLAHIHTATTDIWVKDPVYTYDSATKTLLLAYVTAAKDGSSMLAMDTFSGDGILSSISVYGPDDTAAPQLNTIVTGLKLGTAPEDGLIDSAGDHVGELLGTPQNPTLQPYVLSGTSGSLQLYKPVA